MKNAKQTNENVGGFSKYIGYGVFEFLCLNPNKEQLEKLGYKIDKDPEYLGVDAEGRKTAIIDVFMKHVNTEFNPYDFTIRLRFFLKQKGVLSKDKKSAKVINNYGEVTFLPLEHIKAGTVPENQVWYNTPYKLAIEGQEEFTGFLTAYFGIPTLSYLDKNKVRRTIENPSDAEVGLESWDKIFKGDFSELNILSQYVNKIRLLLGVKTTADNKKYQDVFMQCFVKINNNRTEYLAKKLEEAKNAGRYANTEFVIAPIKMYLENNTASTVTEVQTTLPISLDDAIENTSLEENDPIISEDDLPF